MTERFYTDLQTIFGGNIGMATRSYRALYGAIHQNEELRRIVYNHLTDEQLESDIPLVEELRNEANLPLARNEINRLLIPETTLAALEKVLDKESDFILNLSSCTPNFGSAMVRALNFAFSTRKIPNR